MKMSGNFGKIFYVLITIVAVAGVNIFVINQGLKAKIDAGETGINAGKGFYDYTKK